MASPPGGAADSEGVRGRLLLGVSQPAVSRTLLSLERVLGVRLLHRTSRIVTPTTAGVQVLGRARQLLAEADDPWARRRAIRLEEVRERTVAIDRRTGSTTTDLWPSGAEPTVEHTQDIDDWLAVIATGRCVGIAPRRRRPRFGPVPPAAVSGRYPGRSHTRGLSATSRSRRSERPR